MPHCVSVFQQHANARNGIVARIREIRFVRKQPRSGATRNITHLGGKGWLMTRAEVVAGLEGGDFFYIRQGGVPVWLEVATNAAGEKYVRSETDCDIPESLLRLRDS
jgi:hypothetical protein